MMDRMRAPYNFVPLSSNVVFPDDDWADTPAQDVPFEDGVCGTLTLELESFTPLFIRGRTDNDSVEAGDEPRVQTFFTLPPVAGQKGEQKPRYAIPGSEVRGMLRNVVEIATFGKLSRFNDHRHAVRDLHAPMVYSRHVADLMKRADGPGQAPMPLVDAGWLVKAKGSDLDTENKEATVAHIKPCHFAKIHYSELEKLARERKVGRFRPGDVQSAKDKYGSWGTPGEQEARRKVRVRITRQRPPEHKGTPFLSQYGTAVLGDETAAHLVFTGQPQNAKARDGSWKRGAKQHDFVFHGEVLPAIDVSAAAFEDFEFVHSNRGQQARQVDKSEPNDEWKFWKKAFELGNPVPVFFLRDPNGGLRAFGLAMMFRLAYDHRISKGVLNAQPEAEDPRLDLADLIFGTVLRDDSKEAANRATHARRGRVSFGLMQPINGAQPDSTVKAVLSAPKPSYYPSYVEQGDRGSYGDKPADRDSYRTFMDDDVRIRGWKRYRPHEGIRRSTLPKDRNGNELTQVQTLFTPLKGGAVFKGELRVHNLRKVELGALLWALDFGGRKDCYHMLGLARPLGYGRVQLRVTGSDLDGNDGSTVDLEECRRCFEDYMEKALSRSGGWRQSIHLRDLIALAHVVPPNTDNNRYEGRYMEIAHPINGNEFVEAKKGPFALPPVGRQQGVARPSRKLTPSGNARLRGSPQRGPSQNRGGSFRPTKRPPPRTRSFDPLPTGSKVKAILVERSGKGNWKVKLPQLDARGTVKGTGPDGAKAGDEVEVLVENGNNREGLILKWS